MQFGEAEVTKRTPRPSRQTQRGPKVSPRSSRPGTRRPTTTKRPGQRTLAVCHEHKTDEWTTPRDRWREWHHEFRFTLDAAATAENALCRRFFTIADDALTKNWRGRVWCNPPYSRVGEFVRKASEEVQVGHAELVVLLVASRTDTSWWHEYVLDKAEVRFIRGRLKFGESKNGAPFPSSLLIFRRKGKS